MQRLVDILLLSCAAYCFGTGQATGQSPLVKKKYWTYPMTPKIRPTSPTEVNVAFQVPDPIDGYKFKIVEVNPKKPSGKIRVYEFDQQGRRIIVGEISVGEKVVVEGVRRFSNEHYYLAKIKNKFVWVAGKSIAADGFELPIK